MGEADGRFTLPSITLSGLRFRAACNQRPHRPQGGCGSGHPRKMAKTGWLLSGEEPSATTHGLFRSDGYGDKQRLTSVIVDRPTPPT